MQSDPSGRVRNIKLHPTAALMPLYEAVVNSFQAIEEREQSSEKSFIQIEVIRDQSALELLADDAELSLSPIKGFRIKDNGIGFTPLHFDSFNTADSSLKADKGGKGIGRFLWLKAFESVGIESVYEENNKNKKRTFTFSLKQKDGVKEHSNRATQEPISTIVTLEDFKEEFSNECPKKLKTIATRIVEHCIYYFINNPKIEVRISDEKDDVDVVEYYRDTIKPHLKNAKFSIKDQKFTLIHTRIYSGEDFANKLFYYANDREVELEKLGTYAPNFSKKFEENDTSFIYIGFVSSKYLDKAASQERTQLDLPKESEILSTLPTQREIREKCLEIFSIELKDFLTKLNGEKEKQLAEFVSNIAPEYRPVLEMSPSFAATLTPGLSNDKLEQELHKEKFRIERDLKQNVSKLLQSNPTATKDKATFQTEYDSNVHKLSALGKSALANYVLKRKMILELIEHRLQVDSGGSYSLEKSIHELVFPMGKDSTDREADNQNLWLVDERLTFHTFLTSDKTVTAGEDEIRPDILASYANGEPPFSSFVVVEFKRPQRSDYTDDENPITQILKYVRLLKSGKAKDHLGRPILIQHKEIPVYAYAICDLTPKLISILEDSDYIKCPEGAGFGYFKYHQNFQTYLEVVSYEKLVVDAKRRNRILFEKLMLPEKTLSTDSSGKP